jgi:hypothetical protein
VNINEIEPVAVLIAAAVDIRTTPVGDLGITTDDALAAIQRGLDGGAR